MRQFQALISPLRMVLASAWGSLLAKPNSLPTLSEDGDETEQLLNHSLGEPGQSLAAGTADLSPLTPH